MRGRGGGGRKRYITMRRRENYSNEVSVQMKERLTKNNEETISRTIQ